MSSCLLFPTVPCDQDETIAIIQGSQSYVYRAMERRVAQRVERLRAQGLGSDQVVLVPDVPALDLVLMQHALARLGAALLPYRSGLANTDRQALAIATGAEWDWVPTAGHAVRTGIGSANPWSGASPLALLVQTSGSSGTPKVAMLTAANLLASATASNARLGLGSGDTWLACLRLSHVGGGALTYRCARAGATLLLHEGFDAGVVRRDLQGHAVTHLSLVPPMLARLLDQDPTPPPRLRVLLVGGQALSPALAQRAILAGWPLHVTYGMTETASQIAVAGPIGETLSPPGLVGIPFTGVEVQAPRCGASPCRLRLRGPMLMAGYANPERLPGAGLDGDWFETADLGCRDTDGQLRVYGRADDIRVIGGSNVSLARVESLLQSAPGLDEVVVVAFPDPVWGHRLVGVYSGKIESSCLDQWCREHLSGPERPRAWQRLAGLPLLDSGKYDRIRIEALAEPA